LTQRDNDAASFGRLDEQPSAERRFYRRVGALLLLSGLAYLVWRIVEPVWHPLAWSLLLSTLLAPAHRRLRARLPGGASFAAAVSLLLTVLLFVLPIALIAEQLALQANLLHGRLSYSLAELGKALADPLHNLPWLNGRLAELSASAHISFDQIHGWLSAGLQSLSKRLAGFGGTLVQGAFGAAVNFVLMLFMLFFMLRDGPDLAARLVPLLPVERERRSRLWRHLAGVVRAVFLGIGVAALLHGVLIGLGAWLAGLPAALLIGVLAALLALIPIVGSALIWLPCVLVLAAQGHTAAALFMAVWSVLLVGTIDHVIRPMLISGRASIPALPVFLGVIGGLHAFGLLGLFLGPIVLSVLVALFRYEHEQLAARLELREGVEP
jgi:predicted PurR-regulated permease PerM